MPRSFDRLIRRSSALLVACWLFMIVLVLAGCDGAPPTGAPPEPAAVPTPCAPGELTLPDGTCQPAGLPPDMDDSQDLDPSTLH